MRPRWRTRVGSGAGAGLGCAADGAARTGSSRWKSRSNFGTDSGSRLRLSCNRRKLVARAGLGRRSARRRRAGERRRLVDTNRWRRGWIWRLPVPRRRVSLPASWALRRSSAPAKYRRRAKSRAACATRGSALMLRRHREYLRIAGRGFGRSDDGRCRRGRRGECRAAGLGEQRIGRIELASQRHRLLPYLALAARYRIQLAGDRLERRRLVVLRVDLQQLEVDLLPLRILLQRVLENFLRLRVAAVGEIDLGFGDRIDLVGVDVAQALAAEIAGQRIVAGIDDAAAGRTEHGVRLDVGARNDAVLELAWSCGGVRR